MTEKLVTAWRTPNSRLAICVPFQHGKTQRCSVYFPAWVLLLWPETRIVIASYEQSFAENQFGAKIRDVVNKYGPAFGIHLRDDTNAKGEWVIDGHGGGVVCKGRDGAITGRPADLLILDDMIKNSEEADSPAVTTKLRDWYVTVAYSRLGPTAPIVAVGTRWGPLDLFAFFQEEAKVGGDQFDFLVLRAIAEANDPLGRKPGEALWPERVPLARLQRMQARRPRWFRACWQGSPVEGEGLHFQPRQWSTYADVGDAWRIRQGGLTWRSYRKVECTIVHAIDWAKSGRRESNKTAIVTAAQTEDGYTLILSVLNDHLRYEENAPALARICQQYAAFDGTPLLQVVAGDDDMLSDAMVVECRRHRQIPEVRRLGIRSKSKIVRAQAGIIRSQNGLFLMPNPKEPWHEAVCDQLSAFTGKEGAEDDIADCFGILGRVADEWNPGEDQDGYDSLLGAAGYDSGGGGLWDGFGGRMGGGGYVGHDGAW
jgi:hypothetical protein